MRSELVGRRHELRVLADCLCSAQAGRPRLVLCRGEPGIGKTRLAEELVATAGARGFATAWSQSAESAGAPPFWPWRQVLRTVDEEVGLVAIAERRRLVADLARLAPDVFPGPVASVDDQLSGETRFRSFDAVARLLREVSQARPLLIVLDDAHDAGRSSLSLLQHVARSMRDQRLLVLVNHRDTEPVPGVVNELRREPVTREIQLRGLSVPAVGAQLTDLLGRSPTDAELAGVHGRTGGNPFYVGEIARVLGDARAGSDDVPVPSSVRAAISARLARLTSAPEQVLQAASVVGRSFHAALVARMLDVPVLGCLAGLDRGAEAGLVEATPVPGEYRFVHDLVREAVEAGLSMPDRVRLHRSAAEAIENSGTARSGQLPDLARHWAVAAVAGERTRAAAWIRRAAEEAMHRLAHEEAARLFRLATAVGLHELDDEVRCQLLIAAGTALKWAGNLSERLVASREAAELARRLGRPDLLAQAALALEGGGGGLETELTLRLWCEEALATMDPRPSALRARVLATHSDVCMYLADLDAARTSSGRAIAEAEQSGDLAAVVAAVRARQLVASGPDGVGERARLADRMEAIGRETRDPVTRMWAHLWRIDVAFQRGDLGAVGRELDPLAQCVEEGRSPVARWHLLQCRAVLAQAQGRFADAVRLADQALAALPPAATGYGSAVINRTAVLSAVAMHTGEDADLAGLRARDRPTDVGGDELDYPTYEVIFAVAAAFFLASAGRLAEAGAIYRRLGPPSGWRPIPHATTVCFAFGIAVAIALDEVDDVAALRKRLTPFRGQHVVSGAGAIAYDGPVELYLGISSGHLGQLDDAVVDLQAAADLCAANGARGFSVQVRTELAAVLARRARSGDVARARQLAAEAGKLAAALGMRPWANRARGLLERLDVQRDPLTPREREVAALVARGLTNRQIAAQLCLSERTAQNHVQHILTKLDLANRSQIAVRTVREASRAVK
ncbi:helix-turn-helix transcriptional regulator [Geodermatophilus sp. URMC 64]